jgi:ATP-dependent Clp protease ATP-binding subunit ClpA
MFYFPERVHEDAIDLELDTEDVPSAPRSCVHDIAEIVSTWTGVPVTQLSQEESASAC